jgi:RimJ/RimL family protein N-acetyltransferase
MSIQVEPQLSDEVLSCVCVEPEGMVTRTVRFMPLSIDNMRSLWEKSRGHDVLFSQEIRGDFRKFLELFIHEGPNGVETRGLFYVVDDFVGVFYMTRIIPGVDADVHYSFFDGRFKGRVRLVKEMIRYAFNHYGFRRLSAEIPLYVDYHTHSFVKHLGFRNEGRKRKAVLYKGEWFDSGLYGILREQVTNGS